MNDVAAIARANAISVEAKLTRHSKRADGGINVGLAIHPHGIPEALIEAQIGDRFMVVLVQIDEHEQPIPISGVATLEGSANAPAVRKTIAPENRMKTRCAILCSDPHFWQFLNETYRERFPQAHVSNKEDAATLVRFLCDVESRSEIVPETRAAEKWERILSQFTIWEQADQYVEEPV